MMSPVMPLGTVTVSAAAMVCGPGTVVMASAGSTVRAAVSAVV